MNFLRERISLIVAAGFVIILAACILPASASPVPGIGAILAAYLIPTAFMFTLYKKLIEITGSPWYWWGKKQSGASFQPDPDRPTLVPEVNRYLALWCLTAEAGGILMIGSLYIPMFIRPAVILLTFGVVVAVLVGIFYRFKEVADRIDPAFLDIWEPGCAQIPDIFLGTYMLGFICMMFVAIMISFVLSPLIASGFPSSPIPAVLGFQFYFLFLALFSAPGFVWLTIRIRD